MNINEEKIEEKKVVGMNNPTTIHVAQNQSIRMNYLHNLWMDKTKKIITKAKFIDFLLESGEKSIVEMKTTIVDPNDHTKLIQV